MKRFCIVSAALLGIVAWAAPGFAQTGILHGTVTEAGFGRIEIFTKPGTDKFHGAAYYNVMNDVWNSRNPYAAVRRRRFV